jgi:hypothetical protein
MRVLILVMASLLAFAAADSSAAADQPVEIDVDAFETTHANIKRALDDRSAYSELSGTQRRDVLEALERMQRILAQADSVSQLDEEAKVKLFNDQEVVNTLLTQAAADSRLVCRQHGKTGSHRKTTKCRTVAEIRRERETSQEAARRIQRSHMEIPYDQK